MNPLNPLTIKTLDLQEKSRFNTHTFWTNEPTAPTKIDHPKIPCYFYIYLRVFLVFFMFFKKYM